jgi:uncharacterized protein YbbC (DUF1343 family)
MKTRAYPAALLIAVALFGAAGVPARSGQARVYPGVNLLLASYIEVLAGKRIGLITHRAAADIEGSPTNLRLAADPRLNVVALFAPEHGLMGDLPAGAYVPPAAGRIPTYSLYSALRRPSTEMLAGIDAFVFDLQDVGMRAYTYISTMAYAMQAAAAADKLFVVLDRPNPLGGERVDGPVLDPAFESFIGIYPIPVIHGMTIGELAQLFNREFGIGARLVVIPMFGWQASMQWEDTGLSWYRPSPNIPSPTAAQLHAATGLMEGTNLWVGIGTSIPFEVVLARWLQGYLLADRLNERHLPGVTFVPYSVLSGGKRYNGVRLVLTDARHFQPAATAVHILDAISRLHPGSLAFGAPRSGKRYMFDLVWGTDTVRRAIANGVPAATIISRWGDALRRFQDIRGNYFLYPRMTP